MKVRAESLKGYALHWFAGKAANPEVKNPPVGKKYYGSEFLKHQGVLLDQKMESSFFTIASFRGSELVGEYGIRTGLRLFVKVKLGEVLEMPDELLFYSQPCPTELKPEAIENLLILEDFLRYKVPEEKFDISMWRDTDECGFAGCAAGWATTIPELSKKGFYLEDMVPTFGDLCDWEAVETFFGIDETESAYLFSEESYPVENVTPVMVADRIRYFIGREVANESQG